MPGKYKHLFFDLDRTLYDFESNNRQTLLELYNTYNLQIKGVASFDTFYSTYTSINLDLWKQYKNKEITKEFLNSTRFQQTLGAFNIKNGLGDIFAQDYISISPLQTKVLPGTFEVLDYLAPYYTLHIITNGFEEIQYEKLRRCGLEGYFDEVITSEKAGALKPNEVIFRHAMHVTGATVNESLIIGDDLETDILGGMKYGMDQVWLSLPGETSSFNPTFKINELLELKKIL